MSKVQEETVVIEGSKEKERFSDKKVAAAVGFVAALAALAALAFSKKKRNSVEEIISEETPAA